MSFGSFSHSYSGARRKFLSAAIDAGARIQSYRRDDIVGRYGEPLACDVCVLGRDDAQRTAVIIVGTHGVEGYCGSAIVHRWLEEHSRQIPTNDLKVVIVHAVNPWGFSHACRTTENNIDLNRNFIVGSYEIDNPAHDMLLPFFQTNSASASESLKAYVAYMALLADKGRHLEYQMWEGQSHCQDGLFYTGKAPEWSNATFRRIVREHLNRTDKIGFIDWHTGIGAHGDVVYLIFDAEDSEPYRQACNWWGQRSRGGEAYASGEVPRYRGLLCQAIRQELPAAKIAGAVIEFGTADDYTMFRSDRYLVWLKEARRDDPLYEAVREDYRDIFCPREAMWRSHVLREGPTIIDRLIDGVSSW